MKFDITQILSGRVQSMDFEIAPDKDESARFEEYLPESVAALSTLGGCVRVEHKGEYISVKAMPEIDVEMPCSRCLEPVKRHVTAELERLIPAGGRFDPEGIFDEEDLITVNEGMIDITEDIFEETALAIPDLALCQDDCPGLCPKCGKKMADGGCNCQSEKEIDPRMRIFEKLLKDDE